MQTATKHVYCPQCGEIFQTKRQMQSHLLDSPIGHQRNAANPSAVPTIGTGNVTLNNPTCNDIHSSTKELNYDKPSSAAATHSHNIMAGT